MNQFFNGRFVSLKYAIKGFFLLIKTEHSIIAQSFLFLCIVILGFVLGISKQEWVNQTFAMGLVLSAEGLNTAIEKMADFVHKEHHPKIGFIKDIAAGAVTFSVVTFIIIFLITYVPYLINK